MVNVSLSLRADDLPLVLLEDPLPAPADRTRIIVIDAHAALPDLLSRTIEATPHLELVGHAQDADGALAAVARLRPHIVLMDVTLPGRLGLCNPHDIVAAHPGVRSLILTARTGPRRDNQVDLVVEPATLGSAPLVDVLRGLSEPDLSARLWKLTRRELEVLSLLGDGHDLREIAQELGLSLHTCRGHVKSVLGKLGVHSQLAAVVLARRCGVIASN